MSQVLMAEYGRAKTINFDLYEIDGVDFRVDAADAGADCSIMKDEGAEGTCTNDFVDEGQSYSLVLTATEMQAARATILIVDSATKVWLDKHVAIETYGHPSSAHPFLSKYWTNGAVNDGSASSTVWTFDGFTEATADHVIGSELTFTSGANAGQCRTVTDYTSTVITVSPPFLAAPADNDEFVLEARPTTSAGNVPGVDIAAILVDTGTTLDGRIPAALVGGRMSSDMEAVSGDAVAADNLESQYDTTGLTGDTFPSTQSQLSGIANVGSAIHRPAASYVLTTGTQSANGVSDTEPLNGTRHEHTDAAGVLDLYYQFEIGAGTASSVQVTGYLTGSNDDLEISGYDWVADAWVRIGTLDGLNAATNRVFNFNLFVNMTGSGANFGLVRIRFNDGAFTLTSSTLAVDQIFVAFSQAASGYELGAVWIDTNLTNTNTVSGVDGISTNPVSTIAAANTLATQLNLSRFHVASNSSITFAASQENQEFIGLNWTLALGGQSISNSHITGADVSGTMTAAVEAHFDHCEMDAATLGACHLDACDIAGDLTFSAAASYFILGCYHSKSNAPVIDFGSAVGNTTLHIHDYHGAITIANMGQTGTDVLHFSSPDGNLTLNSNNIGGTVNINGVFAFTNSGSGQTINAGGHLNQATVNVEVDTALSDYDGPTKAEMDTGHGLLATEAKQDIIDTNVDDIETAVITNAAGVDIAADIIALKAETVLIVADTNELQSDDIPSLLPSALVSGRMDSDQGAKTGNVALSAQEKLDVNAEVDTAFTTTMPDSVPADGSIPTREQAIYMITQFLMEHAASSTTITVKKVDGSTTLMTFTLDDATNPTSLTRAT